MASVFTYDPDPPRVASPWLISGDATSLTPAPKGRSIPQFGIIGTPPSGLLSDYNVTKLDPEPQEGPVEFKLHLLLRPRRTYSSSSTGVYIAGSQQFRQPGYRPTAQTCGAPAPSHQARRNRLQQLTTQLLWRLQQSSPYHASSPSDSIVPLLPEIDRNMKPLSRPSKVLAGLEGSRGALYEIGVSDDGALVGLTEDEMEESLNNLRAMAASLGCTVEITRMVLVGDCEWHQTLPENNVASSRVTKNGYISNETNLRHQAKLWVAEAFVTPVVNSEAANTSVPFQRESSMVTAQSRPTTYNQHDLVPPKSLSTEQLRVTLTGPTTSGKSSLLGTLSTATLDNGRGKSRLSLLKHRHELASGMTSSVAQELLGYEASNSPNDEAHIINYAAGNVSSWTDVHASAEHGRVVFVSDSAGHPRYRRTTVRGLVGWAPHWAMLCIAADDGETISGVSGSTASAQELLGPTGIGIDLGKAHLDLCIKLEVPLVIVITKLDLARSTLRQKLAKILSIIKAVGRVPAMLPADSVKNIVDSDLESITKADAIAVQRVVDTMDVNNLNQVVPIIMTSAARGTGIRLLHALLRSLPIPSAPTSRDFVLDALNPEQPACLFHVEDVFGIPASNSMRSLEPSSSLETGTVVAGYLRFGHLSIGDSIEVGPYPIFNGDTTANSKYEDLSYPSRQTGGSSNFGSFAISHSHPSSSDLTPITSINEKSAHLTMSEWHHARIVSIRNLRLPVHRLEAGQVGTIGIVFNMHMTPSDGPFEILPSQVPRVRKGMILAVPSHHMVQTGLSLQAASGFTAAFEDEDVNSVTIGSIVVIYIASIRSSARVLRLTPHLPMYDSPGKDKDEFDDFFELDDSPQEIREIDPPIFGSDGITDVTLELMTNREWIELGAQVLIMPGGGQGLYFASGRGEKGVAGLDGFVGKVIEVVG
ncbi:MAG: hypothetical protein M1818_001492 [Claussenomyces sp. TS43310]|nr:MAG: hypothetical protein M1818_001492 [Claussenomyces sp. TS43310]